MRKDREDSYCAKCDIGLYRSMTLNDPIDNTLHCDNPTCWDQIDRYVEVDTTDLSKALDK